MGKVSLLVCVLAIFACAEVVNSKTTVPTFDCSTIIVTLAKCFTFVANGTRVTKPDASCCNELKAALQCDAHCICEAFQNIRSLGPAVVLDIKKTKALPAACGVSASSIDICGVAVSTGSGGAPAQGPSALPPTSSTCFVPSPSPVQDTSPASTYTISAIALLISLVAAAYSVF
ncbi:hypothetical protein MKW94_022287 [Papaver nudicaule]|uniref:Bifunctional inhibitor/plant lipid transfer protein/seed storage helical domain-containing protein n=1 Tax=Papaver nudicaule TaxID=74823 RepID=A0AA41SM53_PAPNU|nr:hypothetical protein [Papaver nudicaule]